VLNRFKAFVRAQQSVLGTPLLLACFFYLAHLWFQEKIALSYNMAFWAVFCFWYAVAKRYVRLSFHILYYPLALYGLVSMISAAASGRHIHQIGEPMLWFRMLIFPVAITLYRVVPRLRVPALAIHIIVGVGIACWGLLEWLFFDHRDLEHRINGPSTHVMTFSGMLLPFALMILLLWWHRRHWWLGVGTLLTGLALLLTFTRSVWLGWAVAVFLILMLKRTPWRIYALPALILFVSLMPMDLFSRLWSTFDTKQSSNFDRIRMLEAGVEMIKDHPLLGVGPANVKEMYSIYRKPDAPRSRPPHLHNNFVQLWAERGILGLAAYVLFLGLFLRECRRGWRGSPEQRMWAEIGVAVTVGLTVAGLFEFNFGDAEVFYVLLDLCALIVTSIEAEQAEPVNEAVAMAVPVAAYQ
jgi:O-antigen ligase